MTGGWKQKSGWIQILPASCVPFTLPFLSQPSVCLVVSRVRAYFTTDQQSSYISTLRIILCMYKLPSPSLCLYIKLK